MCLGLKIERNKKHEEILTTKDMLYEKFFSLTFRICCFKFTFTCVFGQSWTQITKLIQAVYSVHKISSTGKTEMPRWRRRNTNSDNEYLNTCVLQGGCGGLQILCDFADNYCDQRFWNLQENSEWFLCGQILTHTHKPQLSSLWSALKELSGAVVSYFGQVKITFKLKETWK